MMMVRCFISIFCAKHAVQTNSTILCDNPRGRRCDPLPTAQPTVGQLIRRVQHCYVTKRRATLVPAHPQTTRRLGRQIPVSFVVQFQLEVCRASDASRDTWFASREPYNYSEA